MFERLNHPRFDTGNQHAAERLSHETRIRDNNPFILARSQVDKPSGRIYFSVGLDGMVDILVRRNGMVDINAILPIDL